MNQWYLPQLIDRIQGTLQEAGIDVPISTELPAGQTAWVAIPVFSIAKQHGRPVPAVAAEVAQKLASIERVDVQVAGGFVNVTPKNISAVLEESQDSEFGSSSIGSNGSSVVVELGGMNVAKPMSIGHLRSTIIGDSLQRMYRKLGYSVTSVNHLGDWGTQFGKLLVAYQRKFGDLVPRPQSVPELLDLYIQFHNDVKVEPNLDDLARSQFARLESGDAEVRALWRQFVDTSLEEFDRLFTRLHVSVDHPHRAESDYEPMLAPLINHAITSGVAEESERALIIKIDGETAPLLLRKQDGATLYATRDLATIKYRVEAYQPTKILYAVANEQSLHFRQIFAAAQRLGIVGDEAELVHVKFGLVRLPEGKMSTRAGRVIFLDDVLDEAISRASAVIEEKNPGLDEATKQHVAEVVGIGALKYFDLSHDRKNDIIFDWDRMLSLKGDSAPYIQYSYVRATNILKRVEDRGKRLESTGIEDLPSDVLLLVRELAKYPLIIASAAQQYTPHTVAQYLNELATQFNRFYEHYPVLQSEGHDRTVRLAIVAGVANVIRSGLDLLGIEVVEEM